MSFIKQVFEAVNNKGIGKNICGTVATIAAYTKCSYYADQLVAYVEENLNTAHMEYDIKHAGETMDKARKIHTDEEISVAFAVIEDWLKYRREVHEQRSEV